MNLIDVPDFGAGLSGEQVTKLGEEVAFAIDLLQSALQERDRVTTDPDTAETALGLYGLALEQIAEAAAVGGDEVIAELCMLVQRHGGEISAQQRVLTQDELEWLEGWSAHLVAYLTNNDLAAFQALASHLEDHRWSHFFSTLQTAAEDTGLEFVSEPENFGDWVDAHEAAAIPDDESSGMEVASASASATEPTAEAETPETIADPPLSVEPQAVSTEFIELLINELVTHKDIEQAVAAASEPDANPDNRKHAIESCVAELERLALAAETVGLIALNNYLAILGRRVNSRRDIGFSQQQSEVMRLLPGALLAYLHAPDDASTGEGLVDLIRGNLWDQPPTPAHIAALARALPMVELVKDTGPDESRQKEARPEDVVLTVPDDLNQELLDGLLQELPIHTGEFSTAIQRLAKGEGSFTEIDVAKRAAHTLKGAANTVGIKGIANLTHHIEDILVALSKHERLPTPALAEALVAASDCLEAMGEAVMGTAPEPDYAVGILQLVLDWANRIDREGVPEGEVTEPPRETDVAEPGASQEEPASPAAGASQQHEAMVRIPAGLIDELLRLMGETIISNGQVRERARRLVSQNQTLQKQNLVFLQLANELEHLVDMHGVDGALGATTRVDDGFDPLEFEHYSELHTVSRRLIEAATDAGELTGDVKNELADLNELIEVQSQLHNQSHNTVMRTRMVPVATVTSRLQRSVRQAARLLDKRVMLDVTGTETLVDSNVLNELIDPLMHVLRNAVDHGIEAPAQRAATGKPEEGRIQLAFLREGNQLVVRCRDDGSGLSLSDIRRAAESRGLLAPESVLSDEELTRLILSPGFSTRTESTQVSGRGIGMDIVYSRVLQLKGALNLHTTAGQGLEIELRLPATLISTHALLVRVRAKVLAISSYGIKDIYYITPEQVQTVGGRDFFRIDDDLYPLTDLDVLLHLPPDKRQRDRTKGFPTLLVREDSGAVRAVRVQEIIDSTEVVVKGLGRYIPRPHGVMGATILGDGSVAAVVDMPELMRKPVRRAIDPGALDVGSSPNSGTRTHQLKALVVDDSLSARRATAQFMKDSGFDVRTAIDGLEAAAMLHNWKPDILLVDMEMPRMNGLELTAHMRAQAATATIPIIMITSRSTEKHRRQAESAGVNIYLTKPFGEEQLLRHVTELTAA